MADLQRCGAKTRMGSLCNRVAGWGTSHKGEGRCKAHGGADGAGAPKGNTNALKHGLYQRIHYDCMSEEERAIAAALEFDPFEIAKDSLVLLTIRERRILKRIAVLSESEYITVEQVYAKGYNVKGAVDMITTTKHPTVLIAQLEDALNTIAARKAKVVDQLYAYAKPEQRRMLDGLMGAIGRSLGLEPREDEDE